jgi:hypothetical protein
MDEHPTSGPVAEPFQSEPVQLSGCGKPAVIGCVVVLLIVVAALLVLMWRARDLLGWALVEYRNTIVESLPDDLSTEEQQRLERAFDRATAAIESGDLDPEALQRLQRVLAVPPKPGVKLRREEVLELIQALEAVDGSEEEGKTREASPRRVARSPAIGVRSPLVLASARAARLQFP